MVRRGILSLFLVVCLLAVSPGCKKKTEKSGTEAEGVHDLDMSGDSEDESNDNSANPDD